MAVIFFVELEERRAVLGGIFSVMEDLQSGSPINLVQEVQVYHMRRLPPSHLCAISLTFGKCFHDVT